MRGTREERWERRREQDRERKRRQRARQKAERLTGRQIAEALGVAVIEAMRQVRAGRLEPDAPTIMCTVSGLAVEVLVAKGADADGARRAIHKMATRQVP